METMVTARIDVSRPVGRKLVNELENKKYVNIEYPFIGKSTKTYTTEEVFRSAEKIVNDYFGSNLKLQNL
jgi:hypothetical protein